MKIRIKYAKTGVLRYIGHLDVMRYYQKAIRRAELDVAYSQGYSPHQLITFAAPLGLGVTSEGEYFDAEMNSVSSSEDMVNRLNAQMADGMKVIDIVALREGAKTAMAVVAGSDYLISFREGYVDSSLFLSKVKAFYEQEKIEVMKVTKTRETLMDIKPFIYAMDIRDSKIYMLLSTGSVDNIKPELVMEAMCGYLDIPYERMAFKVHRLETYMRNDSGELVSLLEAGDPII
ncbi:MAG: TIGR03936 family radical SAM-associated protein [Lachnospiraceae bacterium]|nr:TIGR03936 family radical SAM-associated protein [Lachnospiraceae bacterium]